MSDVSSPAVKQPHVTSSQPAPSSITTAQSASAPSYSGRVELKFASGVRAKKWDNILRGLGFDKDESKELVRRSDDREVRINVEPDKVEDFLSKVESGPYARYFEKATPYYAVSPEDRERYEALHYRYEQSGVSWGAKRDKLRDERRDLQKEIRRLTSQAAVKDSKTYRSLERKARVKPDAYGERFAEYEEHVAEAEERLPKYQEKLAKVEAELEQTEQKRAELFSIARAYDAAWKGRAPPPTDLPTSVSFYGGGMRPGVGMPVTEEPKKKVAAAPKPEPEPEPPKSDIEMFQEALKKNPNLTSMTTTTDPSTGERKVTRTAEKPAKISPSTRYDVSVSDDGGKVTFSPKGSTKKADPLSALVGTQANKPLQKVKRPLKR